jgi:hypothetical protein
LEPGWRARPKQRIPSDIDAEIIGAVSIRFGFGTV